MATAQQMPAGPRSARLADDAATAALYATHPRRKASVRNAAPAESQYLNQRGTGSASDLSAASAGAALAHANRKPVEIWQPGRLTEAEKAALYVKDYAPPEVPRPSTRYSAEGLGAAILAVRAQRGTSMVLPTPETSVEQTKRQDRALRAATGAYTTRQRADSAPTVPVISTDSPWVRSAAEASYRVRVEEEGPLDHLDSAMEASRIQHIANTDARLYTSSPPVASEAEERNRRNSLHAAAISMAKDMYDITGSRSEAGDRSSAIYAAQRGQDRNRARKTVSMGDGTAGLRALTLQDAAQKLATEKLASMRDEHAELQEYYGTAPQPPRSRLSMPSMPSRRKRTSSEADATQTDAEQSRQIRNQMYSLRTKLNRVDEKRQQDRDLLMEAARRNVDAAIHDMEMKMYADTGRAPPSIQKQWEEAAQARARQEAEAAEATGARRGLVDIGSQQYMDMADVEAVARTRVQPALDEIEDQAERRRAQEVEARLDAEEQQRQAAIEKEREADRRAVEKQEREKVPQKRQSKGFNFLLRRWKSKRAPAEKHEPEHEEATAPAPQEGIREARATGTIAPPIEATHQMAPEDTERQEKPVTQQAAAPASQEGIREARATGTIASPIEATHQMAPEDSETQEKPVPQQVAAPASQEGIREARATGTVAPPIEATHQMAPEDTERQEKPEHEEAAAPASQEGIQEARAIETIAPPLEATRQMAPEDVETPGASTIFAAAPAPIGAPVGLVRGPSEPTEAGKQPDMARPDTVQRDAAATGATVSAMHTVKPITSPRADSKLKTWFRDRLARRSSGPIPVYPNQPGPEYNTESEVGFTGGAALTGRSEPRGAALSSHPVTGSDLEEDTASYNGNSGDVAQTNTEEPTQAYGSDNGNTNGDSKRNRLRRSFMKTVSRGSPERKTNSATNGRKSSGALPQSKETGTDLQNLRNSAAEQGLPVPPVLKETVSAGRESRFSEDL